MRVNVKYLEFISLSIAALLSRKVMFFMLTLLIMKKPIKDLCLTNKKSC